MNEREDPLQKVITRCWEDEAFKQRLPADPAATLEVEGAAVPEGVTPNVVADTPQVLNLVIPAPPGRLADEQLDAVAGGAECTGKWGIDLNADCGDSGWQEAPGAGTGPPRRPRHGGGRRPRRRGASCCRIIKKESAQ